MIPIDVKTLFLFSAAANIFIIALFATYIKLYKVKNPIINIFILSRILGIFFLIMLSTRDSIPNPISIFLNTTINLFIVFYEVYCISFIERKFNLKHFKQCLLIPIAFSVVLIYFSTSPINTRIAAMSLSVAIIYAYTSYILLTNKRKTKIQHLTGYIFTLAAIFLLFRALGASLGTKTSMFSTNYMLVLPLIFFLIFNLIIPLLLIFILKEKDNQKLNALIKSKDNFFSIIAHDLKGPLGGLQQIGELLWLNDITDEKREKLTKSLYQNSKNTFNLLDNLLKWANTNTGLITYKPYKLNLYKIIHNNINLFNSQVKLKNINLSCNFEQDLFIYADYDMVDTIIRNLISNAIKFTKTNGKIEIILAEVDTTQNICTIAIADNGVGINKETLSKIFEINTSISTFGTDNEKGTGLGLKLCKEFLTINKGKININSNLEKGTKVFISLPLENN
ncbi:HAMP domain-containing histidine kinase [Lutibacter sp. A80]|uniref:sensor histidine kinase n=1 Tax=Lutibacter sp. A80 TaxID=2918453 RepID=UPI001F05669E|nr:HAMP domain-containing sensor histidine kinase [Lutibacter sp. A80]UMB59608.1 HAMP domain-containing histidine kinase [Lutibacter sp. A80]